MSIQNHISSLLEDAAKLLVFDEGTDEYKGYKATSEKGYYKVTDPDGKFVGNVDNHSDFVETVEEDLKEKNKD